MGYFSWGNGFIEALFQTIFCSFKIGKLQWERDIPQDALDNLVGLANADFHQNLGKIIHDIYLTGHNLFKDMPQGEQINCLIV